MGQQTSSKCGSHSFYIEKKNNNTGMYCEVCGTWQKWLDGPEIEINLNSEHHPDHNCEESITDRLSTFAERLEGIIETEMQETSISCEDNLRKNAYCLALQRCRKSIQNIIAGREYNHYDDGIQ